MAAPAFACAGLAVVSTGCIVKLRLAVLFLSTLLLLSMQVQALDWDELWTTPDQQRRAQEAAGDYAPLMESDSTQWQGVGHFRSGDYAAAVDAFSQSSTLDDLYNAATAMTRAGNYDGAIAGFDQVLQRDPEHEKAAHNKTIAEQLKALQQQNSEPGQNDDPAQNQRPQDQNNQNQQDNEDQQQQAPENESDESQNQQDEQQSAADNQAQNDSSQQNDSAESPEQQQQTQQQEQSAEQQEQQAALNVNEQQEPMSEDQQAIEQWLRKIPDDPAGLLRRKLLRSHHSEYPEVGSGERPW